jgi:putative ABC transport system permease protein
VYNLARTGFSPTVVASISELDQIDAVTGVRFDQFLVDGQADSVSAVNPATAAQVVDVDVQDGAIEDLGPGKIAIFEDEATDRGLGVGDTLTVEFASGGPQDLEVAAVYGDATYAGNFLVDLDTFTAAYPSNNLDLFAFARAADGADLEDARGAISEVLAPFPQLELQDRTEFEQAQRDQLNQILVSVNGLLALALFIAVMGISNTLALAVIERTREIGLLRAVGMHRKQVRRMIRMESTMVAVFGAVLGVLVGLLLGVGVTLALPESIVTLVRIPWFTLVVVVIVAAIFGVLAGVLPARRASRLDVLTAIATQ